jgi:hypothetical protein
MNTENPGGGTPSRRQGGLARHAARDASFAGRTTAEMLIGAIPVLGGVVAAAMTALEFQAISLRLQTFIEELTNLAEDLDEAKVSHEYLRTTEFEDIVIAGMEAARRTSNRDKLRMIASILLGAVITDAPKDLDVEGVLTRIRDLSPGELSLARVALKGAAPGAGGKVFVPVGVDGEFQMANLVASGLVTAVSRPAGLLGGLRLTGEYSPTPTFLRIVALMEAGGWTE